MLTEEERKELAQKSFSACVADILNRFYNCSLSGWDIEFCVGRHPIRLVNFGQKIMIAECWRNPEWKFSRFVQSVADRIRPGFIPGFWDETAIRIAVLFGISSVLLAKGELSGTKAVDVAVHSGSLSGPLSVWYARKMGLPIGNIICCCNENSSVWELIRQGQLRTDGIAKETLTPDGDTWLPEGLEQLIYECGGREEVWSFLLCCREGRMYEPREQTKKVMRSAMYAAVVGDDRILQTISGFLSGYRYLLSPYTALVYSGVQDYRVNEKENRSCLILAEKSPECDAQTVGTALHITESEVHDLIKNM